MQSAEVNASLGQASDYIYMLIDNFNKQCDSYGLPFKMDFNGSMEEIYLQDVDGDGDIDVNDIEKGQQIND